MIDYLNKTQHKHIIMIEDPVEYIIKNNQSLIHQKQVGRDVISFEQAIRDAMREDPDIIVVGEMRDQETIAAVLTLAETGHLVISTLHTNDVVQAFDRLIYAFRYDAITDSYPARTCSESDSMTDYPSQKR